MQQQNFSQQLETLWNNEFLRLSKKLNTWALLACIILPPILLIDYPMISAEDKSFFVIIRLAPVPIITIAWLMSYLYKIHYRTTAFFGIFVIMIFIAYRPGNDLNNFLILNAVCVILFSTLALFPLEMVIIITIFYFSYNIFIYFVFYSSFIPLNNSGIAIVSGFSFLFFVILRFRYENLRRNFMQSQQLAFQNAQIKEQNEELEALHLDIKNKSQVLSTTFNELEESNQAILDSLDYARDLQQLLLPKQQEIKEHFNSFFILFRPLNSVSGDFYWISPTPNGTIVVVMDCTGHGVPGALMSMIGEALLKRIIIDQEIHIPKEILNKMHQGVRDTLRQYENNNRDGMDMGIVLINHEQQKLYFAGAHNSLIYFQKQEMGILKGDLFSIGGEQRETGRHFTQKELDITEDTSVYLFTDGFQDQFGGELGKKFMRYRFREMLQKSHMLSMYEQKREIIKTLDDWQGDYLQVDDILVMGFHLL